MKLAIGGTGQCWRPSKRRRGEMYQDTVKKLVRVIFILKLAQSVD
jgi:hypothetical protein